MAAVALTCTLPSRSTGTRARRLISVAGASRASVPSAARSRMLDAEETLAVTGHAVGGVCPFGLATNVPVWVDVSLQGFPTVFPAAGCRESSVEIAPQRMAALVARGWVDACVLPPV